MGSAVSAGADNDELTDNLCKADYIRTARIERIFRAVDRGEYFLPEHRMNAYRDQAWRCNHLHLSAPCIYSEVLEGLSVSPGMSFLNLGSGTGYLSTLVGLILGSNGINHGVEYHEDVIQYANQKLEDFKRYSGAMDEFDFCEPKFMQGNCLCLTTERRYDRVYVGAICPPPFDTHVKSLIKVGGILVMPFHDQLLQVRRDSEATWTSTSLLPVSFANLLLPKEDCKESFELMDVEPDSLEKLCRTQIRNILRTNIENENPQLRRPTERPPKPATTTRRTKQQHRVLVGTRDVFFSANPEEAQGERMFGEDQRELLRDFICNLNSAARVVHSDDSDDDDFVDMPLTQNKATQVTARALSATPEASSIPAATGSQEATQRRQRDEKGEQQPRRKFDSGLGDDEELNDDELSSDSGQAQSKRTKLGWFNRLMKRTPDCMTDSTGAVGEASSEQDTIEMEQELPSPTVDPPNGGLLHRNGIDDNEDDDDEDDDDEDDSDEEYPEASSEDLEFYRKRRHVNSPYTALMCAKINELPLPSTLKNFLNYYRF